MSPTDVGKAANKFDFDTEERLLRHTIVCRYGVALHLMAGRLPILLQKREKHNHLGQAHCGAGEHLRRFPPEMHHPISLLHSSLVPFASNLTIA